MTTSIAHVTLDYGEAVNPISLGGTRPATGLYGVKITGEADLGRWDSGNKGLYIGGIGWEVAQDPMATGAVGRGEDDHRQSLPMPDQKEKDRNATKGFLQRFVTGVCGREVQIPVKISTAKLCAAVTKFGKDTAVNEGIRYLHYTEFIEDEQDSRVTWLTATEFQQALEAFKTTKADVLYRKPRKSKRGKGKGDTDLGAAPDIGADVPDADDVGDLSAASNGGGTPVKLVKAAAATETVDDIFNLG